MLLVPLRVGSSVEQSVGLDLFVSQHDPPLLIRIRRLVDEPPLAIEQLQESLLFHVLRKRDLLQQIVGGDHGLVHLLQLSGLRQHFRLVLLHHLVDLKQMTAVRVRPSPPALPSHIGVAVRTDSLRDGPRLRGTSDIDTVDVDALLGGRPLLISV